MGKVAKTSRKGKKAWRANISTGDIDDFYEKATKDALTGGSLDAAPADSIFYVDTSRDFSIKRKIEKHRDKVLRHESILQKNPYVQAVSSSAKKSKKKKSEVPKRKGVSSSPTALGVSEGKPNSAVLVTDIWASEDGGSVRRKKKHSVSHVPAVEVEPPGCSFNPPFEAHQESLARAVAEEMHKAYHNELGPEPVPLTVPGVEIDEEEMYFLEADKDSDDDLDSRELDASEEGVQRSRKVERVTRVELNRRARRQEQLKLEEEEKKKENIADQIDCLSDILDEIAREDEEKGKRHVRRTVAKQERFKSGPPRLGKRKFEAARLQVLLSDEISGSLRKLKGCSTLARDRYKSLEKRGLIVPGVKRHRMQCTKADIGS